MPVHIIMSAEPFIIFFAARLIRRNFRKLSPDIWWDKILLYIMIGTAVLAGLQVITPFGKFIEWMWHVIIFILIYFTLTTPRLTQFRPIVNAILPLVVLIVLEDILTAINPDLKRSLDTYLGLGYAVTITWMVILFIRSRKESKALETEREKAREEQERARFMEAQKIELEKIVAQRTAEIMLQKNELQQALVELKSTQTQLIHSEKMASLGELTAGIAHEIQNPLNFVNNFSEINNELIDEMKEEINAGNIDKAFDLAGNIRDNSQKIIHHGQRADGIVKGMLQHSRASNGQKEPTNINALADEYLRLSYHGLRAKDKSFNATINTDFDPALSSADGKIMVTPQDMGRAFLNLFTNAFFAVADKQKQIGDQYKPTVSVCTKRLPGKIEVHVKDNGNGISEKALDKIFQPFFTTKPSGQGTGLGLSLCYEIITQGHGGELRVETKEGEYAEFIITIPILPNK